MIILFAVILAWVAGAANAMMDVLESKWDKSIFKDKDFPKPFFDSKQTSWVNKYDAYGDRLVWFKIFNIKILKPVAFTDAWHLGKSIMLTSITAIFGLCILMGYSFDNYNSFLIILIAILLRASFGFGFSLCYKKWLILLVTFFVFSFQDSNAQEVSKKQERLLNRLERTGLQLSDNADTIYIEKPVLRTIVKKDTIYLNRIKVEYRDTCEKSRFELRHERKSDRIENSFELSKLRQDYKSLQESNNLTKYLADRMLDSMQKVIRLERIEKRTLSDSLSTVKKLAKTDLKTTRIQNRGWNIWGWMFYILSVLGAFAISWFITKKLRLL